MCLQKCLNSSSLSFLRFCSKLASKFRREDGSYSFPSLVLNQVMKFYTYSFSSSVWISLMFFSSFLFTKNNCNNSTSRCAFCAVVLFCCSEIKSSTEPASRNLEAILFFSLLTIENTSFVQSNHRRPKVAS